jgi:hypothetical protein
MHPKIVLPVFSPQPIFVHCSKSSLTLLSLNLHIQFQSLTLPYLV